VFATIFYSVILCLLVGLVAKLIVDHTGLLDSRGDHRRISWIEFAAGSAAVVVLIVPVTVRVGSNMAKAELLEFDEHWTGYETNAGVSTTTCTRDGSCRWTYRCDSYTHRWTTTDADGNTQHHSETRYHDCPHATEELTWVVNTTFGDYTIERTLAANPQEWRAGSGLPDVRRGEPPFWTQAAERIRSGDPGPVVVERTYDNYILAAQNTILDEYEGDIERFEADGLLPPTAVERGLRGAYWSNKVHVVGSAAVPDVDGWLFAVDRFNAALGMDLQGDLNVVFVPAEIDEHVYEGVLNAWWTGPEFGDRSLSKNAIVVIIGTDGETVVWSEAFTGMPVGNERLLLELSESLDGLPLDPDVLLGRPVGVLVDGEFDSIVHGDGAIENLVWGDGTTFARICMTCDDPGENGGYGYLAGDIQPTTGHRVAMGAVSVFLAALMWAGFVALGNHYVGSDKPRSGGRGSGPSYRLRPPGRPHIR